MKPSAWVIRSSEGTIATTSKGEAEVLSGEPVYSAEEIRKWLMEEPSAEVIHAAVESYDSNDGSMVEYCRGLFAAKLEELK
jgi:hypothetical protein